MPNEKMRGEEERVYDTQSTVCDVTENTLSPLRALLGKPQDSESDNEISFGNIVFRR